MARTMGAQYMELAGCCLLAFTWPLILGLDTVGHAWQEAWSGIGKWLSQLVLSLPRLYDIVVSIGEQAVSTEI